MSSLEPVIDADVPALTHDDVDFNSMSYSEIQMLMSDGGLEAYVPAGATVIGKEFLLGVPLFITAVTFQMPSAVTPKKPVAADFISCEATIASAAKLDMQIRLGRVLDGNGVAVTEIGQLPFEPDERVVINDGGTGMRRDIVNILNRAGIIHVGNPKIPAEMNPLDAAWTLWESPSRQMKELKEGVSVPHITLNHKGNPLLIDVRRGLRVSEYEWEGDMARTYYLS